jgi:hypothetical protein
MSLGAVTKGILYLIIRVSRSKAAAVHHCVPLPFVQRIGLFKTQKELKFHLVLMYRKLSLSIIENVAFFGVIELSVFVVKIIDNS